jgi:hypothetical protein
MRKPGVLVLAVVAVAAVVAGVFVLRPDDAGSPPERPPEPEAYEPEQGTVRGSVEAADGSAVAGAEVAVTAAGSGEALGDGTSDPLGLFAVEVGDHDGPVVVQATQGDDSASTVVAVSAGASATGVRVVVGPAGPGQLSGNVAAEGAPVTGAGAGVVEVTFVETGRTAVADITPEGTFSLEGLPVDGDLIVVATLVDGGGYGLVADLLTEDQATRAVDVAVDVTGDATGPTDAEIVSEDLSGWSVDGSVTVLPSG